jgi:hypothetical protein
MLSARSSSWNVLNDDTLIQDLIINAHFRTVHPSLLAYMPIKIFRGGVGVTYACICILQYINNEQPLLQLPLRLAMSAVATRAGMSAAPVISLINASRSCSVPSRSSSPDSLGIHGARAFTSRLWCDTKCNANFSTSTVRSRAVSRDLACNSASNSLRALASSPLVPSGISFRISCRCLPIVA